jgi:hypothetical protein
MFGVAAGPARIAYPKGIIFILKMLPIFMFDDLILNQFLKEDSLIIVTIVILPPIIHGILTYSIINNLIYIDTTTHILITTHFLYFLGLGSGY